MIEQYLFEGFIISGMLFAISHFLVKFALKRNGYSVSLFDLDFSDIRNFHHLAKKQSRYMTIYWIFIILIVFPLLFFGLF